MPLRGESLSTLSIYVCVFLPFAVGHFLSYILRSINAVLAPPLSAELSLDASQIGVVTSAYFLAFAVAQLPVGMALDRFGPRRVQLVLMSVAALGCVLFAQATSFPALTMTRGLIGLGLAACFMAALKAIAQWVPPTRMPSIHGALLAVGGLGAMASTVPVQLAVETIGWRALFWLLGGVILATGIAIRIAAPEPDKQRPVERVSLRSTLQTYRHPGFLRTIAIVLIPHTVFFGLQTLWIGNWLHDVAGLDEQEVGLLLMAGMASMVAGTLFVGHLTEFAGRRGIKPIDIAALGLIGFLAVQIVMASDQRWLAPGLAIAFPVLGAFAGLQFTIVSQSVPASLTGRASTCLNLLIFTGAFLVQAGFGSVLAMWAPMAHGGYPVQAYQTAFGMLILLQIPGLLFWLSGLRRGFVKADRSLE